jgi:hypothetical protein
MAITSKRFGMAISGNVRRGNMNQGTTPPGDFSHLKLKTFVSPDFGLVFNAPDTWVQGHDQQCFQVADPATGSAFTASAYENPGLHLEQWANLRFSAVEQEMPYLKCVRTPYGIKGRNVGGIASEYQGVFPDSGSNRHYLVFCLCTDKMVISFTITALVEVFAEQEAFYRWLLQTQLDVYKVQRL